MQIFVSRIRNRAVTAQLIGKPSLQDIVASVIDCCLWRYKRAGEGDDFPQIIFTDRFVAIRAIDRVLGKYCINLGSVPESSVNLHGGGGHRGSP